MRIRLVLSAAVLAIALISTCMATARTALAADDWRSQHPEITVGVITGENEADRTSRWKPVLAYLSKELGVKVAWRPAADYAGVIEGMKAGKVDLALFGAASYAKCWIVTGGQVEPLLGETDQDGNFGYHSIIVVKADSPYKTLQDLKGKKLAWADPNSTSGFQAPAYFLREDGINADTYFATSFSGSHENGVMGVVNGTFDAAATAWNGEKFNYPDRMAAKGMIPAGSTRIVWKSPKLPYAPWTVPLRLPAQMRADIKKALQAMQVKEQETFDKLMENRSRGFIEVDHAVYEPVVRMIKANQEQRKQ